MEKRVTLRDIAQRLGIHHTTVSRALREDPSLPPKTRRRIQAAAREMNYRPDPLVNALTAYRTAIRPVGGYTTLAWISPRDAPTFERPDSLFADVARGARERAEALGFRIEEFPCRAPGMTPRRLSNILKSRGIRGVLVAPWPLNERILRRLRLDWDSFSAVGFGHGLLWPPIPRVSNNHYRSIRLAVRELFALGYRKIGACLRKGGVEENWKAGFQIEMQTRSQPAPVLEYAQLDYGSLRKWIRATKLEAVIVPSEWDIPPLRESFRIPEDLGAAALHVLSRNSEAAGIYQNFAYVGARAVDLLVSFLHANQRGIPEFPERVLIEGEWVPGKTLRRIVR